MGFLSFYSPNSEICFFHGVPKTLLIPFLCCLKFIFDLDWMISLPHLPALIFKPPRAWSMTNASAKLFIPYTKIFISCIIPAWVFVSISLYWILFSYPEIIFLFHSAVCLCSLGIYSRVCSSFKSLNICVIVHLSSLFIISSHLLPFGSHRCETGNPRRRHAILTFPVPSGFALGFVHLKLVHWLSPVLFAVS